jgi:hypothetical protein
MSNPFTYEPTDYTFESTEPADLQQHPEYLRNLEVIKKQPHELVCDDLINWGQVESNRREYVRKLERGPHATIWDYIEPPVGTYLWYQQYVNEDTGLARLEHVHVNNLLYYSGGISQWDLNESYKIERYRSMYRNGSTISTGNLTKIKSTYINPIRVFRDKQKRLFILDGYKRHRAAELEKVKVLSAWVFEVNGDFLANRTHYIEQAIKEGKEVPKHELSLVGESYPLYVPPVGYQDLRKRYYPPVGKQIDAMLKAVMEGDKSDLKALYETIKQVKARFPKE